MPLHRLILLRHGKAEERALSGQDFDRALAARGQEEAREIGRRLAEGGFVPDIALVSPARRAAETWAEAAGAFPKAGLDLLPVLYNADPAAIMRAAEASGAASVIVVCHNPGVHSLAVELSARGPGGAGPARAVAGGFPTAAAAVFRFDAGGPVCEAFLTPGGTEAAA